MLLTLKLSFTIALSLAMIICCDPVMTQENEVKVNCYTCDSTNPNCLSDPNKFDPKLCESKTCFTKQENGKVSRGCLASGTACNNPNCYQCTTDKCNTNLICKNCTSVDQPDCAKTDASKEIFNAVCSRQQNSCISLVIDGGHLERRCAKESDKCANDKDCSICTGTNCNAQIFPTDRRRCYQCQGNAQCGDVDTNSDTIKSLPCLMYSATDKCYTIGSSPTTMTRGCISDPNKEVNKCSDPATNKDCGTCVGDNCNNRQYQRDQKYTCIQCSSSTDTNCQFDQKVEDAKGCKEKLLYNQEDSCYLEKRSDKSVERGCLYDRAKDAAECKEPDCIICESGNGCNRQENGEFTCIRCRSDINAKCANKITDIVGTKCRNQDLTSTNKDCYMGTWNNVVIRGCLVDADDRQKIICNDDKNKQCLKCDGKDCNIAKMNGATGIQLASSLIALFTLTLWHLN